MQIDWFTFSAQIINFLILILLLRRFLYKPVVEAMDRREREIAGRIEDARLKMVAAEEKETEYEQSLNRLEREKDQMLIEAREQVEQTRKELLAEARSEVQAVQQRWEEALEHEKQGFIRELEKETGSRILEIVRKILKDLSDRNLEEQTAELFIERLSMLERRDRKRMVESALEFGKGEIVIRSSFELSTEQQERILNTLKEQVADEVECTFEVAGTLGFGIELRAGGWRTGWNLNAYLRSLRNEMEQFFARRALAGETDMTGL